MKVLVCIKQVPDTNTKIQIKADKSGIETSGVKWVMNPYDEFAVEEAIKFKEANAGAAVFVATVGPKARAQEVLRTALAMGADEGIVVDAPENADNFMVAKALKAVVEKEGGFDLIFTGKMAIDDQQNATTQMLAKALQVPYTNVVSKWQKNGDTHLVEREIEGGAKEVVELSGKAVIGANKGLNTPRYASLPGIMKAKKKPLKEYALADLSVATSPLIQISDLEYPADREKVKMIAGEAAQQVQLLVKALREEAKII